ncbi:MAG: hypothetical protein DMF58_18065 [Acidobacteria bacterium]|nr:MAG: hypothetical protein DMF58_18065 [Acidobacteriota bacterium]
MPSLNSKSMFNFARTPAGDRVALATYDGRLEFYSTDTIVNGGAPLAQFTGVGGGTIRDVACDGTNFYAATDTTSGLMISVFAPSGNTYTKVADYPTTDLQVQTMKLNYADGYLTLSGSTNVRVFKLQNGIPVELNFDNYFQRYYFAPSTSAYTVPSFHFFWDSALVKKNNHVYLIATAYSLGDVYELPSTDSVLVTYQGNKGTPNPKTSLASDTTAGPFYGDPIGFIATTAAPAGMSLNWDFGDGTPVIAGSTGTPITHQFSRASSIVKATNVLDSSINSSVPVTLSKPTIRFGFQNYNHANFRYLFEQPNASSAAPIVAGDSFFDASDGSIQSHYDTWVLDGTSTNLDPTGSVAVGACGAHNLTFSTQYGPYSSPGVPTGAPVGYSINPFIYSTRPFAAFIDVGSDASSLNFTGHVRTSHDTNAISPSQASMLSYKWELLDGSNQPVPDAGTKTGMVGGDGVVTYNVDKSFIKGRNYRGHLTVTGVVQPSCASYTVDEAFTDFLNPPDPQLLKSCTGPSNNIPPCTFSVISATGSDMSGWNYHWSVSPTNNVSPTASSDARFSPVFTSTASQTPYTVYLTVDNAIASAPQQHVDVTVPAQTCPTMIAGVNVFIAYSGHTSGCTQNTGSCAAGETLSFSAAPFGYDFTCSTHTYSWTFGDGGTGTGASLNHVYASPSTYSVTLTIANAGQSVPITQSVIVGGSTAPAPAPAPVPVPSGACSTMTSTTVFVAYNNPSNSCNQYGGTCGTGDNITFTASAFGYDFSCANHTFSWTFGDGQVGTGKSVTHKYSGNGTFTVGLSIFNGTQTFQTSASVVVGGGTTPNPTPTPTPTPAGCAAIVAGQTFFVGYSGPQSGCTQYTGDASITTSPAPRTHSRGISVTARPALERQRIIATSMRARTT